MDQKEDNRAMSDTLHLVNLIPAPLKFTSSHLVDGRLHRNREMSEFCASSIISRLIKKDMQNVQSNAAK